MFGFTIVPGGSVKNGETQEEAMIREAGEEYGVIPTVYKKLGVVHNRSSVGSLDFRHVFLVTEWEGELSNRENRNEHLEASLEEARELCVHPILQKILDLIEKELTRKNA
jgi:8-oxo-dGTP pyrophosphatase MutT (NUDIX family)